VDTVGGLIVTWLGRPPQIGDTVKHQDVIKFTVLDISGLAVARAKIEFPTPEQNTPTQE
jgi:CBS domain containing-hemolysin-like protein